MTIASQIFCLVVMLVFGFHAHSEEKIRLGSSMPTAGAAGPRALEIVKGAEIYFERINKSGCVHSRKIEMIVENDNFEPKQAHDNVEKFIEKEKVFALFQVFGSASNSAIMPLVKRSGIPFVCPIAPAEFLRYPAVPNIFNIKNSFQTEIGALIKFLVDERKLKKIALFRIDGDASGVGARAAAVKELLARKMELAAEAGVPRNTDSFEVPLKKILDAKPDAVIITTVGKITPAFILAWAKAKAPGIITLFSPAIGGDFAKEVKDVPNEIYISQSFPFYEPENYPVVRQYIDDSKAANVTPSPGGIEGYVCAMLMTEVLKRTGKDLTREKFIKTFDQLGDIEFGGLKYHFDPQTHQGSEVSFLIQAKDGKLSAVKR